MAFLLFWKEKRTERRGRQMWVGAIEDSILLIQLAEIFISGPMNFGLWLNRI